MVILVIWKVHHCLIMLPFNAYKGQYHFLIIWLHQCYDLRFPELSQSLRRMGSHILTFPSAFTVKTGQAHWEALLRARAIGNNVTTLNACTHSLLQYLVALVHQILQSYLMHMRALIFVTIFNACNCALGHSDIPINFSQNITQLVTCFVPWFIMLNIYKKDYCESICTWVYLENFVSYFSYLIFNWIYHVLPSPSCNDYLFFHLKG